MDKESLELCRKLHEKGYGSWEVAKVMERLELKEAENRYGVSTLKTREAGD